jgi:hypothetical protein
VAGDDLSVVVVDAPSNLGLSPPGEEEQAHFLTLSLWDSIEDVKRFAGPEPERAKYYPADEEFLLDFEPMVEHYEVVVAPRSDA